MIRLFVLLAISLTNGSVQAAQTSTVTERDVAVFRAVIRAGLISEPDVGDRVSLPGEAVKSRTAFLFPAVISQTLRLCRQPADVGCVPESSMTSIRLNAVAHAAEIEELTNANTIARTVPPNLILTVPPEQVFRGARTWSDVWSLSGPGRRKLPECVQFTVPAYVDGAAVVYAQRLWDGVAYGWLVRLKADAGQWRVVTKRLVWASHVTA